MRLHSLYFESKLLKSLKEWLLHKQRVSLVANAINGIFKKDKQVFLSVLCDKHIFHHNWV